MEARSQARAATESRPAMRPERWRECHHEGHGVPVGPDRLADQLAFAMTRRLAPDQVATDGAAFLEPQGGEMSRNQPQPDSSKVSGGGAGGGGAGVGRGGGGGG